MRSIAVCCLLVLGACATPDVEGNPTQRSRLDGELQDCAARTMASPDFQALRSILPYGGGKPDRKATPAEAEHLTRLHHEHLRPCQEIQLEIAGRIHPSLPPLYNAAAAKADAMIAQLVRREITWVEYGRTGAEIRRELNARLEAAQVALRLPTLAGLNQPSSD